MTQIKTSASRQAPTTMADWLLSSFGESLTEAFFEPFNRRYTVGLHTRIAPQDAYKSPVEFSAVVRGASVETQSAGYNVSFVYPQKDLNALAHSMARKLVNRGDLHYGKKAIGVDARRREVRFGDGSVQGYGSLISTLPLNEMMLMTGLEVDAEPDPYTSVLVLNIGAVKGSKCPMEHWLYIPDAREGFHRVGFYSNVDTSFLPFSSRESADRVSIYIERAYIGGYKPSRQALACLQEVGIYQVGRYGRWVFQGIADSIRDGLVAGAAFKHEVTGR